ncbi:MAG: YggT family protein [Clostridia bacterium]|nr:YggT family protein [Clostridia bacterium]
MSEILYVVANFVDVLLNVLYFAIFGRVLISWLPIDEDGPIASFLYLITDPIILPIRAVMERFSLFQNSPLDFSSFFAMILLMLLQALLGIFQ